MSTFLEQVTECEHRAYRLLETGVKDAHLETAQGTTLLTCPALPGPRFNHLALIRVPATEDRSVLTLARRKLSTMGEDPALALSPATFPPSIAALPTEEKMVLWTTERWLVFEREALAKLGQQSLTWSLSPVSSHDDRQQWLRMLTGQTKAEVTQALDDPEGLMWLTSARDGTKQIAALAVADKWEALVHMGGRLSHPRAALQAIVHHAVNELSGLERLILVVPEADMPDGTEAVPILAPTWSFQRKIFARQEERRE